MACFLKFGDRIKITIPKVEERKKFTVYIIQVEIGDVTWTVGHRYKDFVQLHEVLVSGHSVAKDLLPPKKVLGNKDPSFIEERRNKLEVYLFTIVRFLQKTMPKELAFFLNLHLYDILFLLQNMAEEFFTQGDVLLLERNHTFSPLELYSISERLKQPCPSFGYLDQQQDFSHVLDYCLHLPKLKVQGNNNVLNDSNIIPNKLPFEFSAFKSLETLILNGIRCEMINDFAELRTTLKTLEVHNIEVYHLTDLLLCDQIHKTEVDIHGPYVFKNIINADFSYNQLIDIDKSIQLLPNVEMLSFEGNKIQDIENLSSLINLKYLNLSANLFKSPQNLELKLCRIIYLNLSQNLLTSLKEFSKLYSLEALDVSSNRISDVSEVKHISNLPCLENLILTGNSVSIIVDYRIKVLELFGNRASEICLDNEKSNQKELDKVAILQALRAANESKTASTN